ncbi:hypothetical protein FLAPJACK_199 [Bacillus phage Flapjack]|uniref:Uncharacterized protein n=1 Tax=Bacillus phage Flapjack TaxID=1983465 RepID=A0A1X9SGC7_9CAUD|nr:hypothetical protein FLAPJACK_199 [Bacillus phage Flapjack]
MTNQTFYIIETGICDEGEPYQLCREVPEWWTMEDIDDDIQDDEDTNIGAEFEKWSFRLSTTPVEEYGLWFTEGREF